MSAADSQPCNNRLNPPLGPSRRLHKAASAASGLSRGFGDRYAGKPGSAEYSLASEVKMSVVFKVETEQEVDGRWLAEVVELPGAMAYGATADEALARVQALALRVVADRLEQGEAGREFLKIAFQAA